MNINIKSQLLATEQINHNIVIMFLTSIINYNFFIGELWTSVNYGQSFTSRATYDNGKYLTLGGLAMSSDGSKAIAAVYGLGKLGCIRLV